MDLAIHAALRAAFEYFNMAELDTSATLGAHCAPLPLQRGSDSLCPRLDVTGAWERGTWGGPSEAGVAAWCGVTEGEDDDNYSGILLSECWS